MKIKNIKPLGKDKTVRLIKGDFCYGNTRIYSNKKIGSRYVVSLDYDAQEYKLSATLSGDSAAIDRLRRGLDPHTSTAYAIWGEENYDKKKRKKAKICLGDSTLIQTNHGYMYPTQLGTLPNTYIIGENGEEQTWVKEETYGDLVEVTYDNGITESYTPEHKIKVWNGSSIVWKEVQDLVEGDTIVQNTIPITHEAMNLNEDYSYVYNGRYFKNSATEFPIYTKEFAYLGGLYLGDGNMQYATLKDGSKKPNGVSYCVQPESLEQVKQYFNTMGLTPTYFKPIGKNGKIIKVAINNIAWAACIEDTFSSTKNKRLNEVFNSRWGKEEFKAFVAGLIDTDGYVQKGRVSFSTTSNQIQQAIVKACTYVGIKTSVRERTSKYNGKPYPWVEVRLWDIPEDLPILNANKKGTLGSIQTQSGTWSCTEEVAKYYREQVRIAGFNNESHLYKTWSNVIANKCGITQGIVNLMHENKIAFPIQKNMAPLQVVATKATYGHVNIIQTSNHVYNTLCTISHNCNFCMQYGGGAYTLANSLDVPVSEAEEIIRKYEAGFRETVEWKESEIQKMYQNEGIVFNVFGRPRQFKGWINTINKNNEEYSTLIEKQLREKVSKRVQSAMERRVSSHEIQGSAGDILRKVLIDLYVTYFRKRDPHIDFMSTVHDEVNYTIDKEVTLEYVKELEEIMKFDAIDKTLPITTSTDIGYSYGNMFPFMWEDETKTRLIPIRVHHA